ncbi:hypothetical protein [Neobacillus sp. D3-1R]|uniref:hypothetical protein n=1 Tax=Neobacillus sp. D3-1R TaxID=3445778 RepID=UPI003F9EE5E0
MMNEKEESVFDLVSYRDQKQLQAEKNAKSIYSLATDFAIRYSNIREKVRAKHLFRQQIYFHQELPLPNYLEELFQQWFLFDYHTIQGETMFSLFLKNYSNRLTEPEMILGALFLTTYVEPFEIIEVSQESRTMLVRDALEAKKFTITLCSNEITYGNKGEYVFLRRLPLVTKDWAVGPVFSVPSNELAKQVIFSFMESKKNNSSLTWRAFLKRQGYFLLAQVPLK